MKTKETCSRCGRIASFDDRWLQYSVRTKYRGEVIFNFCSHCNKTFAAKYLMNTEEGKAELRNKFL